MFRVMETGLHLSHPQPDVETAPVKTGAFYIVFNTLSSLWLRAGVAHNNAARVSKRSTCSATAHLRARYCY